MTEPADRHEVVTDLQSRKAWASSIERARQIAAESRARLRADKRRAERLQAARALADQEGFLRD